MNPIRKTLFVAALLVILGGIAITQPGMAAVFGECAFLKMCL